MANKERKYLAHFIDVNKGVGTAKYVRLGKDLEEYNLEFSPDTEIKKNILGEQTVVHNGYEVTATADTFYIKEESDDELSNMILDIINNRSTGADCETTVVDVLFKADGTVLSAYRENVIVVPQSFGGDTSGVQAPFEIQYNGGRTAGTWNNGAFTPAA